MKWTLDKSRPLCAQLCEQLCVMIANGKFAPNERLLSVRDVATNAGVNPNTVQRAFETLERDGVLYSIRGSGWFVAEDIKAAKDVLANIISQKTAEYFLQMKALGLDSDFIKQYVKEWKSNE